MSFLDTVARAKTYLREHGRVSLRGLKREFELDDATLEELVEELVDIQQIAAREGKVLSWIATQAATSLQSEPAAETTTEPPFEPTPQALEAERRQLTVLFCDLVDSTRLAAGMDAEDWREVVRGYQEAAAEVVERFDGHVAQYLGDGLLVYFGWPRAHEDDPERAVRAGLGIVEAVEGLRRGDRPDLSVRVGIHTGAVVVGEMGGGASRKTLAMGDTTNVAARIQGEAEPDTVALSSASLRLVSGIFVTRDLGEQVLKGLPQLVHVHRAVRPSGVRSRLDVMAAAELTPFIGRDQELMLLEDRWAQVREGWGQAVLISGEAGIGKSRLMQAFRERLADQAHTWLECRASPYTQDSAFYPVLELQRLGLGFRPEDPAAAKLEGIEAGLEAVGFDLAEGVPLMAGLHGVPIGDRYKESELSPEGRRKRTLELLGEWLMRLAERQPLVLLVEDLHWMDPSTLELMGQILDRVAGAQVLLLLTHRPDFEPTWGARSHLTPMLLSRLTRAHLADLIRKAARGRDLPEAWVEEILRRADGVPLFAEELTRTVLETNPKLPTATETPQLQIPDTLQDSLMARLDALGPVKELAQLGAVLGREFSYHLLLKASPMKEGELQGALAAAVREELFYQRGTPPEATYLFKHALIRDAAYASLVRSSRRHHHRRVAETLIERMPEVVEEQPELVAHHLTEAGESERAIAYWQRAAEAAAAGSAHEEAIRHLRRALALLGKIPESTVRHERELALRTALGVSLQAARGFSSAEVEATYRRARELCEVVRDPAQLAAGLWGSIAYHVTTEDLEAARELAEMLRRHGESEKESLYLVVAEYALGNVDHLQGRFLSSLRHNEAAMVLYDTSPRSEVFAAQYGQDFRSAAGGWLALSLWCLGHVNRAVAEADRALAWAERRAHPFSLAFALLLEAIVHKMRRDDVATGETTRRLIELSDRHSFPLFLGGGTVIRAWSQRGSQQALAEAREGVAALGETGNRSMAPHVLETLAELTSAAGHPSNALGTMELALAASQQLGQPYWDAELHRRRGELYLQLDDHSDDEAAEEFFRALEIARSQKAMSLELRAATSLARLWRDHGNRTEACALLQPVYDWFTEGFDTQDLEDAKALLEELE
jgi:class 3 adenylate cyclase/predicted ATPase